MIHSNDLIRLGQITKPHGIKGEMTATLDFDLDLLALKCIVIGIDGINVPFFPESVRPKSTETIILSLNGVSNENEARELCGNDYHALKDDVDIDDSLDATGGYLSDFIGFTLRDINTRTIGEIIDFDDSTENILFIIRSDDGNSHLVPVAEDLITKIDPEGKVITMNLPEGLFD
ncbi:MAG: ribosome maturation factor RimM [Paramuribaculum sp.]|nr:ribosome maturation factor RimM [Paramuribaculum sp.]MDE6489376.1 ribosome maturation factor RimM [Paramuribaculum sp.]